MIREMRTEDWDRVKSIYKQGIQTGYSTFNTECPAYAEWDAAHLKTCRYVCETDGWVCGWVALSPTSARSAYRGVVEVSIYVDDAFRRQGIGTELLNRVSAESEKQGFWSLYSVIFSVNEASIRLHQKCGFRVIGYREKIAKDRFGSWQNTTVMEKRSALI